MLLVVLSSVVFCFDISYITDYCVNEADEYQNICPLVRNQNKGYCWIYSATNLLSIEYRKLTGNELQLSIEQTVDFLNEYLINIHCNETDSLCAICKDLAERRTILFEEGGYPQCALYYMQKHGIMEEYFYPYSNGQSHKYLYDQSRLSNIDIITIDPIMPVQFNNIIKKQNSASNYNNELKTFFNFYLPFTVSFYATATTNDCIMSDYDHDKTYTSNHAVVAVGIYEGTDHELYLKLLNSWGVNICIPTFVKYDCTNCDEGYNYLRVTEDGGTKLINNRDWLSDNFKVTIDDRRSSSINMNNMIVSMVSKNVYDKFGIYGIIVIAVGCLIIIHILYTIIFHIVLINKHKQNKKNIPIKTYQNIDANL